MDEKCKASYRNLNTIKSYSEQKYATVQWCQQNCENDEYLKRQVDQLRYLTPPAVRQAKKITEYIDYPNSYGCSNINETQVGFKSGGQSTYYVTFSDDDTIQVDKSNITTCVANSYTTDNTTVDENDNTIYVLDSEGNRTHTTKTRYELPTITQAKKKNIKSYDFGTINLSKKHNSSWYIGFNKSKDYYFKPNWLGKKGWRNKDIPSVVRAQTFKVPKGKGGKLKAIDLGLEWSGSKVASTGSPLYVQIWKTYTSFRTVQNWNNNKGEKHMEYVYIKYDKAINQDTRYKDKQRYEKYLKKTITRKNGKKEKIYDYRKKDKGDYVRQREEVQWIGHNKWDSKKKKWLSDRYHPLAQATYTKVGDNFPTITFDTPCTVKEGKTYAIVLFSPLSEWKHCPRWKGWGRNCKKDNKYPDGYAFMSENNGRTWKRYGKDGIDQYEDKDLTYKQGKYTPQDFMFQCRVEKQTTTPGTEYYSKEECSLYLEPIYDNPITHVSLSAIGNGFKQSDKDEGRYLVFEISTDGDNWTEIIPGSTGLSLEKETNTDDYPHVLLVRVRMWRDDDKDTTPFLESITINLTTLDAKEFYARTKVCTPRTDNMLGANLWGRLYAPFELESSVDCNVEIIEGETVTDHIYLKTVNELDESLITELELDTNLYDKKDEAMASYLTKNPSILDDLKKESIYILPSTYADKLYLLSFSSSYKEEDMLIKGTLTTSDTNSDSTITLSDGEVVSNNHYDYGVFKIGGISFSREVAYPIQKIEKEGNVVSDSNVIVDTFREWIDYTFDYTQNLLFFKESTLFDLTSGSLAVTYNPIFISRLTQQEVGRRIDKSNNTVEEGLILDYFKENITITKEHIESRSVPLRVLPVDPIREVLLFKYNRVESDDYINLYENYNYTLNTLDNVKPELVFEISSIDGTSTILDEGDILQVVYTPSLEDASLYAGYYATRNDTSMQCKLNDMYWEYKV